MLWPAFYFLNFNFCPSASPHSDRSSACFFSFWLFAKRLSSYPLQAARRLSRRIFAASDIVQLQRGFGKSCPFGLPREECVKAMPSESIT
jgi:hypothetical protein